MSAKDLSVAVFVLPPSSSQEASRVYSQYTFSAQIAGAGLQTISQKGPGSYGPLVGLFYAPLDDRIQQSCSNETLGFYPSNVTSLTDIPAHNYPLVSIFPWTSKDCNEAFLNNSSQTGAKAAIIFNTNGGNPPGPDDASWAIQNDSNWRDGYDFPIYAISTDSGKIVLNNMALYSGNLSSAPFAAFLLSQYSDQDLPRLGVQIDVDSSNVPSLWTFLIIVLAVLLGLVISASVIMHFIQRHQRRSLERRLQRGEVDLESLGIKKMNVPQEKIDAMPLYAFTAKSEEDDRADMSPNSKTRTKVKTTETAFSQPTCPICLDDFIPNETMVRELPCKHIFHPDCIDPFIRDNSSLCPMCKKSALPAGFCPVKVTNLMVRRERLIRRMRERRRQSLAAAYGSQDPQTGVQMMVRWVKKKLRITPPSVPAPDVQAIIQRRQSGARSRSIDVEMAVRHRSTGDVRQLSELPPEIARQDIAARRAWRRERLAQQQQRNYDEQAETARRADEGRSLWRRAVDRVLPGFG